MRAHFEEQYRLLREEFEGYKAEFKRADSANKKMRLQLRRALGLDTPVKCVRVESLRDTDVTNAEGETVSRCSAVYSERQAMTDFRAEDQWEHNAPQQSAVSTGAAASDRVFASKSRRNRPTIPWHPKSADDPLAAMNGGDNASTQQSEQGEGESGQSAAPAAATQNPFSAAVAAVPSLTPAESEAQRKQQVCNNLRAGLGADRYEDLLNAIEREHGEGNQLGTTPYLAFYRQMDEGEIAPRRNNERIY